ncbi:class II glutamine amidotransferase [Thioclava sp. BHET1]|nr:class II glutamine amidotransferase [Thioclava sp. BHET1]
MCELFALSSNAPVNIRYDLDRFAAEGGELHQNRDGWGIVFTEGRDAHCFREANAASQSPLDRFLREHSRPQSNVIAHVRRASRGAGALENTHPFRRIRAGRAQHFAHNGTLNGLEDSPGVAPYLTQRVGETDSELAFLLLLDRLEREAPDHEDIAARFEVFRAFCGEMAGFGSANFLWLDGTVLYVHSDQRVFETPEGLSKPQPPGLHLLTPAPGAVDRAHEFTGATLSHLPEHLAVFASLPLSDADWEPLPRGTVMAVAQGKILHRDCVAQG